MLNQEALTNLFQNEGRTEILDSLLPCFGSEQHASMSQLSHWGSRTDRLRPAALQAFGPIKSNCRGIRELMINKNDRM